VVGVSDLIRAELRHRQLANRAWGFLADGSQAALEPTCLALLALSGDSQSPGPEPLLEAQSTDGSWKSFEGDTEGSGLTGLALLTLNAFGVEGSHRQRAQNWLLHTRGREARWPWRWKFRISDTRVQFDPDKFGWPWQPATCSWVVPTAFAVLALKQTFSACRWRKPTHRIGRGVQMLFDRACPGGGWNAGNGVVYGCPMTPHIDATAIALLGLQDEPLYPITETSLGWLERKARLCQAPWSLAWAILALQVYDRPLNMLQHHLLSVAKPMHEPDNGTLAVTALALDCMVGNKPFGIHV
jgi:hypothetical protein